MCWWTPLPIQIPHIPTYAPSMNHVPLVGITLTVYPVIVEMQKRNFNAEFYHPVWDPRCHPPEYLVTSWVIATTYTVYTLYSTYKEVVSPHAATHSWSGPDHPP